MNFELENSAKSSLAEVGMNVRSNSTCDSQMDLQTVLSDSGDEEKMLM